MKLVIDRSKWLRGTGAGVLFDGNRMCCLGFFGLACGYTQSQIAGAADPQDALRCSPSDNNLWPAWLVETLGDDFVQSNSCDELIAANDEKDASASSRERVITRLFARHGVEVEFVDREAE